MKRTTRFSKGGSVMEHHNVFRRMIRGAAIAAYLSMLLSLLALSLLVWSGGCHDASPVAASGPDQPGLGPFESTGEEFLISALDEIELIAGATGGAPARTADPASRWSRLPAKSGKRLIHAGATDSTYIYGELTPDGYGAVVTERHAYPKGILLITVRKSYGKPPSRTVTETKRYISQSDFLKDSMQQSNITEVYGLSQDTIVTHVERNGTIETYTFRLPVVSSVTNPRDGSVRVTTRYAVSGSVVSDVRDGSGSFIQLRKTSGSSDGSLNTYTLYGDSTWRNVRSIGKSDGSVYREITSGP
jgi:hypothetical protein